MSVLLNLALVLFACAVWSKNRPYRRNRGLFEVIVRTGMEEGHKISDDSCIELLLTGKLNEEATDFFRWAASECFAWYPHDRRISRIYEVWLTPAFDRYRIYSDKTPVFMFHSNLTDNDIRGSDVHDLNGKAPGVIAPASPVVKKDPSRRDLQDGTMPANVNQEVDDAKGSAKNGD